MTMEILAKLGGDLHAKLGKSGLVLAVWFDFICGTSTNAIIAACAGWDMACRMLISAVLALRSIAKLEAWCPLPARPLQSGPVRNSSRMFAMIRT